MFMMIVYVLAFNYYVSQAYIKNINEEDQRLVLLVLLGGMLYPVLHELMQMLMIGPDYFFDTWNWIDIAFILSSVGNVFLQYGLGPRHILSKLIMILIVFLILFKTMFYLRIFPSLTPIIVMLG